MSQDMIWIITAAEWARCWIDGAKLRTLDKTIKIFNKL